MQVAKLGEAEVMADAGIDDILVGYPIVGEQKLRRLADLAERVSISVTVDSGEVALGVARVARERGLTIPVLLELDTGMHRLGVLPGPAAVELAERIASLEGLELAGVFTHEGHVYTQGRDAAEKERMTREACRAAVETAEEIRARGLPAPIVSVGSAGTFRFAIRCPGVTEVRPGTYVFNDRSQLAQGAAEPADLAAFAITTVVSRPAPDRIVVDAGSKVLTSDRMLVPDPPLSFGQIWGHDDWDVVRLSEEHGVVSVPPGAEVRVGDRLGDRAEPRLPGDQPREPRDGRRGREAARVAGRSQHAASFASASRSALGRRPHRCRRVPAVAQRLLPLGERLLRRRPDRVLGPRRRPCRREAARAADRRRSSAC